MILPRYHVAASKIPGAGKGLFLDEEVTRGRLNTTPDDIRTIYRWDEIEAQPILFPAHSSAVTPEQARIARTVADKTKRWVEGTVAIGRIPELDLRAYASGEGSTERNIGLSQQRAAHAAQFLLAAGVPRQFLSTRSEGSRYSPAERKEEETSGRAAILKLFYRSPADSKGGTH